MQRSSLAFLGCGSVRILFIQRLFEPLSAFKKNNLAFLMQQSSLAFLGCGSVRILFSRCFRGNLKTLFQMLSEPLPSHDRLSCFWLSDAFSIFSFLFAFYLLSVICSVNRTEWNTIQGVIKSARSTDLKLRARLPLICTTLKVILPINCFNNKMRESQSWNIY